MTKAFVSAIALCLLAGCTMPPRTASDQPAAHKKADCQAATGSHIVDESDCGGYASGAVKRAVIQTGSGSQVFGCPSGESSGPCDLSGKQQ
jgi:hypothetical protein